MNWFETHLNWTYVLAYVLTIAVRFLVVLGAGGGVSDLVAGIVIVVGVVFIFIVSGWVIQQKGRSLWWILLFTFFSPLWLSNMATKTPSSGRQLKL